MKEQGLRYNTGKARYDLLEPYAIEQLVKVFTRGAEKYAPHNWLKGLPWMEVVASLERHLAAFKQGEDFDKETELLHMAHVAWNALAIVSYYKHAPQYDNRRLPYLQHPKIGLDIDEVLCDWVGGWIELWGIDRPKTWFFDRDIMEKFNKMKEDGTIEEFYLNLKPKISPCEIPFEPHCYVTSRPVPTEITERWLDMNGFSARPVYTVHAGESKLDVIKSSGLEVFVDDRFDNFEELNKNGICTFLMDAEHNRRYNVGYKRIYHLKDLL
jgi:hypothetical protein